LAELILYDCAKNQEDDSDYANQKGFSTHKPALPLYGASDVAQALKLLRPQERENWFCPAEPIWTRYHEDGHLLGASMIEAEIRGGAKPLRILFSGDVGRYAAPLYHDPSPPPACDYLICESTYGDRDHPAQNVLDELCDVVSAGIGRGGVILVASFAVGRAQQLIYLLRELVSQNRIPEFPVFLDSPMAVNATNIYRAHAADHELTEEALTGPQCVFSNRNVHLARTVEESKQINGVSGPAVIISSSGMMTGGRILHHLQQRLGDARNTILLGGFMAEGTRGRALAEGAKTVRLFGRDVPVRAAVAQVPALSGHAGRSELLRWLAPLPAPRQVFLTHGELPSATALAAELARSRGWNTMVPHLGQSVELT
jgi:metallo-beta-lactamase family protein